MEVILVVSCVLVSVAAWAVRRRWIDGASWEPWFLIAGALFLVGMAWAGGLAEARGPAMLLAACASIPLTRAVQIFRARRRLGAV